RHLHSFPPRRSSDLPQLLPHVPAGARPRRPRGRRRDLPLSHTSVYAGARRSQRRVRGRDPGQRHDPDTRLVAGDRIVGAVGTHETALASPDIVDLGGRCVIPGITDSHTHFPTWAAARQVIRLEDATSAEDAAARMAPGVAATRRGRWFRAQGFRESNWPAPPTSAILDSVTGDVPAAVISKDFHAVWLNSAGIARTGGDMRRYDVPGGVVEVGADGEPTGLLREESAWRFKEDHLELSDDEYLDAMREGLKVAASR